ncbi:MAG: hypothetical protein JXQ96_05095 [Cyclobacteriaceae bacterium]
MFTSSLLIILTLFFPPSQVQIDSTDLKTSTRVSSPAEIENKISYDKGILRNKLDYQLVHGEKGRFILKFADVPKQNLEVKIYDVIGNLIQSDNFSKKEGREKEYDFSGSDTKIYVVKVSNQKENVVKKINI